MSLKIAIIGCGNIATGYHGPALKQYAALHPDVELVACCDTSEEKARQFAERFGVESRFTDFAEMLGRHRPDAVCLFTPAQVSCEIACRVLSMGFNLLLEKPPGRTNEEVTRLIAAAEASGKLVHVAFNRRHMPLVTRLCQSLREEVPPGDLHHIHYEFARWNRTDLDFSQTAIHGIDTIGHLAGSNYTRVDFRYQPLRQMGATVANTQMDCTFASGVTAHLSICPVAGVIIERAMVHARDHTFILNLPVWNAFDSPGRLQHLYRNELVLDIAGSDLPSGASPIESFGIYGEDAAFLDAVRAGESGCDKLRDSRQAVAIAEAMRRRESQYIEK